MSDRLPWEREPDQPEQPREPVDELVKPYPPGRGRGYATAALDQEVARVAAAANGTRNHSLNRAAFSLGQLVAGGELAHQLVVEQLTAVAQQVGLDTGEIAKTIASGLAGGAQHPRTVPEPANPPLPGAGGAIGGDDFPVALLAEVHRQRLAREARRILDAEDRPPAAIPEALTLAQRLAQPHPPVTWRVDGWQPAGSRVMLAAQFKAGKTTLVGNLVRSLADGAPFLDQHRVDELATGTVAILDFEMSARQLDQWLADQNIANPEKVVVLPMRGSAGAFDILDPAVRARWVTLLRQHQVRYLVLDCLRPVLDALGLDEHREAGRFLVAFDTLLADAGIPDALVVHHMGHQAERSRGDSRIRDWPDVEWRLVRQDEDPASARYLSSYGRDVDQPESALAFDPATRHLRLMAGSRKDAAARAALADALELITAQPGLSGAKIESGLMETTEHRQKDIRAGLKIGVHEQSIMVEAGPRGARLHFSSSARCSSSQLVNEVLTVHTPPRHLVYRDEVVVDKVPPDEPTATSSPDELIQPPQVDQPDRESGQPEPAHPPPPADNCPDCRRLRRRYGDDWRCHTHQDQKGTP